MRFGLESVVFFVGFLCFFSIGCDTNEEGYVEVNTRTSVLELKFEAERTDTVHLEAFYSVGFPRCIRNIEGYTYLGYLNPEEKTLSIHNLTLDTGVVQVQLSYQDSFLFKRNGGTASMYIQNLDSIFVYHDNRISLLNRNGQVFWSEQLFPVIHDGIMYDFIFRNNNMPLYFHQGEKSLSAEAHCLKCTWAEQLRSSVDSRLMFSGTVGFVPVNLSKRYVSDSTYAGLCETYRITVGNIDYYTFPIDPNVYSFNRSSGEINVFGGRSGYQKRLTHAFHSNDSLTLYENLFKYTMESGYYSFNVLQDPYRDLFYRFYIDETPIGNRTDGTNKDMFDKPIILMVFDNEWGLIEEIPLKLGKSHPIQTVFVEKDGLYIDRWIDNHHIVFDKYTFSIKSQDSSKDAY